MNRKIYCLLLCALVHQHSRAVNPEKRLFRGAKSGNLKLVKRALRRGADIESKDKSGATALIIASKMDAGHAEIVKFLIQAGAEVNAQTNAGTTALMFAAHWNHEKIAHMLLNYGADVDRKDALGRTALLWATHCRRLGIVALLTTFGADIAVQDEMGDTVFHENLWTRTSEERTYLQTIEAFCRSPKDEIAANSLDTTTFLFLSIAYKKDKAFKYLVAKYPHLVADIKIVARCFLLAAHVGNIWALHKLKNILKKQHLDGLRAVYLKAFSLIMKVHPELAHLAQQLCAEDIAPV